MTTISSFMSTFVVLMSTSGCVVRDHPTRVELRAERIGATTGGHQLVVFTRSRAPTPSEGSLGRPICPLSRLVSVSLRLADSRNKSQFRLSTCVPGETQLA